MKISFHKSNRGERLLLLACSFLVSHHLIGTVRGDDSSNATAFPAPDFEPALNCGNQSAYGNQNFVVLLGGGGGGPLGGGSIFGPLAVPHDTPVGPSCGNISLSGKGFWFPIEPLTRGELDLVFCTASSFITMVPIVYTARRTTATTTNCEALHCVAEGITDFLQSAERILLEGSICPNANSFGGVHFTATEDQFYFVHVDVTGSTTELSNLQATSMVTNWTVPNDHGSGDSSGADFLPLWILMLFFLVCNS